MPPISLYTSFTTRPSDLKTKINPLCKYFFICEGANTESFYFKHLIDNKKELGFGPTVSIILMEKTGEDRNLSYIKTLIEFSKIKRKELIENKEFDEDNDKIIIVFDLDIFKEKVDGINEVFDQETNQFIFAFTYPSFELFLLLHIKDSYEEIIKPNEKWIFENKKSGNKRPCEYLILQKLGINPKKNSNIGLLAENLDVAIDQEMNINQTKENCLNEITSNVGLILKNIRLESQLNL